MRWRDTPPIWRRFQVRYAAVLVVVLVANVSQSVMGIVGIRHYLTRQTTYMAELARFQRGESAAHPGPPPTRPPPRSPWLGSGWYLVVFGSMAIFGSWWVRRLMRRARAADHKLCPACGYELMGHVGRIRCPECGGSCDVAEVQARWKECRAGVPRFLGGGSA